MPTYDYRCDACGHELELFQRMSEDPIMRCPSCGDEKLRRLIGSGAGIIFKGSGFYETDYKRTRDSKPKKDEGTKESKSADKKSSDSKSAKKDD